MNPTMLIVILLSPLWAYGVVRAIRSARRRVQEVDARRRSGWRLLVASAVAHAGVFLLPGRSNSVLLQVVVISVLFTIYGGLFTGVALLERPKR